MEFKRFQDLLEKEEMEKMEKMSLRILIVTLIIGGVMAFGVGLGAGSFDYFLLTFAIVTIVILMNFELLNRQTIIFNYIKEKGGK